MSKSKLIRHIREWLKRKYQSPKTSYNSCCTASVERFEKEKDKSRTY
ncbi:MULTISPECIES: hypothetical protein [Flammeovirga]|uniref:Uncharacterized protein n=1 Tax=Flammeovirga agarivorans TaxID=2726742 RepID=A0A7X8SJ73_9BACT|nr:MULTISPECIES: hypothetical protein [Flammeovirga]NLR91165.1 hypothetical protein [Flammeovirga agarivorans]